jgi:small subunit ribosomal protein S1
MSDQVATQTQLEIGAEVSGTVKHIGMYGALVDIGTGQDALLHISQLAQDEERKFDEVVQKGADLTAYVLKTRKDGYVALAMEKPPEPPAVPWQTIQVASMYTGSVIRIENFGVFVDFGAERPGMVHVSEMADGYVKSPADVVNVGDEVEVRVLKKNNRPRQIDLSMKPAIEEIETYDDPEDDDIPTSMAQAFRRAMEQQDEGDEEEVVVKKKSNKNDVDETRDDIVARTLRNAQS